MESMDADETSLFPSEDELEMESIEMAVLPQPTAQAPSAPSPLTSTRPVQPGGVIYQQKSSDKLRGLFHTGCELLRVSIHANLTSLSQTQPHQQARRSGKSPRSASSLSITTATRNLRERGETGLVVAFLPLLAHQPTLPLQLTRLTTLSPARASHSENRHRHRRRRRSFLNVLGRSLVRRRIRATIHGH